jgi:elongation factor G
MAKADVKLLEPIMKVEVVTPEEYMGGVIGDLNSRRGQINNRKAAATQTVITAMVPLANMFGYVNTCARCRRAAPSYTMQFDHYEPVPANIAEEVRRNTPRGQANYDFITISLTG